ncbi:group II intron reverse transcriptase/maturase [Clostridium sp. CF011]|nr:group II intron reverse transcriptase/maturase [Clostridium sp. CF011]
MQNTFDSLYEDSSKGKKFTKLMQYIASEQNILLAYRNVKKNKGSITAGTDKLNIDYIKNMGIEKYVKHIQDKFNNYQPKSVRRVEIPKANGKTRPLGIPCIDDRIIQQCIKQVLEPICEVKFHNHSYGFRPNRSTQHAIARSMFLMNQCKLHYVVDIDISGFFDNVNHSKLKKQMWNLGIQDKNLLSIVEKILKSKIEGIGIPYKGTPQGGIISPLLSNIVLNELDWWISSQWETFETSHDYRSYRKSGQIDVSHKYTAMRTTKLKELWLVRYADDFKIFCKDIKTAQIIFIATKKWLKKRLGLDISMEKSKITNLRKNHTEFLGFKLMVKPKNKKFVCQSNMCDKAKINTINKLKKQIRKIQKKPTPKEVCKLNAIILGIHNYYKIATRVSIDFGEINFLVRKTLNIRLRGLMSNKHKKSKSYEKLYGDYKGKTHSIRDVTIFPISFVRTKNATSLTQSICNYTPKGRELIHSKLKGFNTLIKYLLINIDIKNSVEFNDNRISLMIGQKGNCYVTGKRLIIGNMECHHKKQKSDNGTDEYKNLVWLSHEAHKLVHCSTVETINKYVNELDLNAKGLKYINSLRKLVGNSVI